MAFAEEPPAATTVERRRTRWWWISRLVLAVVVLLFAYYGGTFVQVYRASTHDGAREADAIVVLGAAQYDGRPSPVLQERLDHALELYEDGVAPVIVLTGGKQETDTFTEATAGYNYLRERGLQDEALLREVSGTSTWDSLRAARRFLLDRGIDRIVLVTDDYHAYRARATAQDIGFDATVSPSDSLLSGSNQLRHLTRETAAVAVGRIIGYGRLYRLNE
jgi:uncharacterized SAM-binding protein YcdF (DUF218 family)